MVQFVTGEQDEKRFWDIYSVIGLVATVQCPLGPFEYFDQFPS